MWQNFVKTLVWAYRPCFGFLVATVLIGSTGNFSPLGKQLLSQLWCFGNSGKNFLFLVTIICGKDRVTTALTIKSLIWLFFSFSYFSFSFHSFFFSVKHIRTHSAVDILATTDSVYLCNHFVIHDQDLNTNLNFK